MGDPSKLTCPYCDKKYNNRGLLTKHIKQFHENALLLDQNMTVLQEVANDESCLAAGLNLSENPLGNEPEKNYFSTLTSTPTPAPIVPLCLNANNYIIQRGKSLPASFLATLLPAPGFIEDLNDSLQEHDNENDILKRFEENIRCNKCKQCEFTCLGSIKLEEHMKNTHQNKHQPSSLDSTMPSLGDYLVNLENKIDTCNDLIKKQSVLYSKQTAMIEKLLVFHQSKSFNDNNTSILHIPHFKCNDCDFDADSKEQLIIHTNRQHMNQPR